MLHPNVIRTVLWVAFTLIVSALAWYFVKGWRDSNREGDTDGDVLANLRELRERGALNEKEFREVKTRMGQRFGNDL